MSAKPVKTKLGPLASNPWQGVITLVLVALCAATVISGLQRATQAPIERQRQAAVVAQLGQVIPGIRFDNHLVDERHSLNAAGFFQTDQSLWWYPVRQGNKLQAVIFDVISPDGYNGDIRLLIGISRTGQVTGVRVTQHLETPGLGDAIDYQKSHWVDQFIAQDVQGNSEQWRVRRQGGNFDALSSATVTSSAMIAVVERSLRYFQQQGLQYWSQDDEMAAKRSTGGHSTGGGTT